MIVAIIGGTGTLASALIPQLIESGKVSRIRALSRGEHRQIQLSEAYAQQPVDFFVGDCRDLERMLRVTKGADLVFHLAAMKSVDKAELDPQEAVLTNIKGTQNVIRACIANGVKKAVFTSTDKAVAPVNIYGATKLVAEKLWIAGNIGNHQTRFSVCRYGNVLGSQGSVIEKWFQSVQDQKSIRLTNHKMTRFFISPAEAAKFVHNISDRMCGAEIFIPKMKSVSMGVLASRFSETFNTPVESIPSRHGEKIHECLISDDEIPFVTETDSSYIRWPDTQLFPFTIVGDAVKRGFTSENAERLSSEELGALIQCALDSLPKSVQTMVENSIISKKSLKESPRLDGAPSNFNSSPTPNNLRNQGTFF